MEKTSAPFSTHISLLLLPASVSLATSCKGYALALCNNGLLQMASPAWGSWNNQFTRMVEHQKNAQLYSSDALFVVLFVLVVSRLSSTRGHGPNKNQLVQLESIRYHKTSGIRKGSETVQNRNDFTCNLSWLHSMHCEPIVLSPALC